MKGIRRYFTFLSVITEFKIFQGRRKVKMLDFYYQFFFSSHTQKIESDGNFSIVKSVTQFETEAVLPTLIQIFFVWELYKRLIVKC